MKLGKDEIQKVVLSLLLLAALLYVYFGMMLAPLAKTEKAAKAVIAELTPKIDGARKQLKKTEALEAAAPAAQERMDEVTAGIPEGAPVAWFPPRVADFLKRHGIERSTTRLNNELPVAELPQFKSAFWSVEIPRAEFYPLATAIAALENEEPLLEITHLTIESSTQNPRHQRVLLTLSTLLNK